MFKPKIIGHIVVAFVAVTLAHAQQNDSLTEKYVTKDTFEAEWGNKPGEVGVDTLGCPAMGPVSFTVDKFDNLYILDGINHKIEIYNKTGQHTSSVDWGQAKGEKGNLEGKNFFGPSDIASDGKVIYLVGGVPAIEEYKGKMVHSLNYEIRSYDFKGNLLEKEKVSDEIIKHFIPNNKTLATWNLHGDLKLKVFNQKLFINRYKVADNSKFSAKGEEDISLPMVISNDKDKKHINFKGVDIVIKFPDKLNASKVKFLGNDNNDKLYFLHERAAANQEIFKYDINGVLITKIIAPGSTVGYGSLKFEHVSENGDFYGVASDKNYYRIIRLGK